MAERTGSDGAAFVRVTPRLPVKSLDCTIAFYRDILGFEVAFVWPEPDPTFAMLLRDQIQVAFFETTEHNPVTIGSAELYIEVADAKAMHQAIRGVVTVEWGPEVYTYKRREFAIRDPDRYLVVFTEPTDDPPTTDEP
jgi:catechol 2,3-dioxygenase-like lactoylglutathione lyase family enzyme